MEPHHFAHGSLGLLDWFLMRQRVLYDSVRTFVPDGDRIELIAHMWTRRSHSFLLIGVGAAVGFLVSLAAGFGDTAGQFGIALAAAAAVGLATTDYRILVATTSGLMLLKSSKLRQKAVALIANLPPDTVIEPVGSNLVISDWRVGTEVYSVMKRFQSQMTSMSRSP